MEAHVPGGEEMLSEQSRTGLKPEVVLIIYFWFIFRKLREFLYLNAAFLVLEYTFLGRTEYFSSFDSLFTPCLFLLQGKCYLFFTWNSLSIFDRLNLSCIFYKLTVEFWDVQGPRTSRVSQFIEIRICLHEFLFCSIKAGIYLSCLLFW